MPSILLLLLLVLTLSVGSAAANCVNLNVAAWTPEQRTYFKAVATTLAGEEVDVSWVITDEQKPDPQVGVNLRLCAATADLSGLNSAAMQSQAQALHVAQAAIDAAKAAEKAAITAELQTSPFCITATLAQIDQLITDEKAVIMADVNAIDATGTIADTKLAMTTQTNRVYAALKALLRCIRAVHKNLEQP